MNVLSLFDGMSCGQIALERAGIKVNNYFAAEIDKHAIKVTQHNYPNTKQLGDVTKVKASDLPKIDLLIGGSPCQSFSFAGKRKGMATKDEQEILTLEHYLQLKEEGFEFEGQSYLFWEYMRLLNEVNPKYFLLENVEMGDKWERVLSKAIGFNGIHINSALVSGQNRKRIYWTNIGMQPSGLFGDLQSIIEQPKDKKILLKDILESEVDDKYFLSEQRIDTMLKSERSVPYVDQETKKFNCLIAGYGKIPTDGQYYNNKRLNETIEKHKNKLTDGTLIDSYNKSIHKDKSITLRTTINSSNMTHVVHNMMPRSSKNGNGGTGHLSRTDGKTYCLDTGQTNAVEIIAIRGRGEQNKQQIEPRNDGKTNSLTTISKDNLIRQINQSNESGGKQPYHQNRVYDVNGINPALTTLWNGANLIKAESNIRRLTPIECERLQTVPDNYTSIVSDSQRYKMLGNGWTIDVIAHIFNYIKM